MLFRSDTTTVTVSTGNVTENDAGVTFDFQLSNSPQGAASLTVMVGATAHAVALNAAGYGTLFVATNNPDVYIDPTSVTATVTAINGGNFEATSVAGATATAQVADTIDTTTVTLNDVTVLENGTITYTASVNNVPQTAFLVTLSNGVVINFAAGSLTGSSVPQAPQGEDPYVDGSVTTVSIASTSGGNYEALNTTDTATVTIKDTIQTTTVTLNDVIVGANGTGTVVASVDNAVTGSALIVALSNGATATILVGQTSAISTQFVVQGYAVVGVNGTTGGNYEALNTTDTALQNPDFSIAKDITSVTGGMGQIVDSAGDVINYKIVLANTGNVALTGVSMSDPFATTIGAASGDTNANSMLDVGETWTYAATHTVTAAEFNAHQTLINIATADTVQTAPKSDDASTALQSVGGLTAGFWGQHFEAWDGVVATNKGVIDTANLVASGVLTKTDVLRAVDSNKDGFITISDAKGVLLGDANTNGLADDGVNLFVSLAAAQQIIRSSDSANDTRQILMKQALAAQLNINNGDVQPKDLISEAVKWLEGKGPYLYGTNSTGNVDKNGDGILGTDDYNTTSAAFLVDANGSVTGTALTSNLNAWQTKVDVDDTVRNVQANGEGLKNALMYFNQNQLITTSTGDVAFSYDHITVMGQQSNGADAFWHTLNVASPDIKGIGAV